MVYLMNIIMVAISIVLVYPGLNRKIDYMSIKDSIDLMPAQVNYLVCDVNYLNRGILATLLDLYIRGNINIEKYIRESRNKKIADEVVEYRFQLLNRNGLNDLENEFLDNVFFQGDEINTDLLTQEAIHRGSVYYKRWGQWTFHLEETMRDKNLITDHWPKEDRIKTIIGYIILVISVVSIFRDNIVSLVGLVASFPIILMYNKKSLNKTEYGQGVFRYFLDIKNQLESGNYTVNSELEMLDIIALSLPVKYYENICSFDSKAIDFFLDNPNRQGGSTLDDAVMRGFLGFRKESTRENLDTNRISIKTN